MDEKEKSRNPITIKDISQMLHVSTGTVHRALQGKKGVGEVLRKQILQVAQENGYIPNEAAAVLKRKKQRILAAAPILEGANRYFFSQIWNGLRDCVQEMGRFSIDVVSLPYSAAPGKTAIDQLTIAYQQYNGEIDGIWVAGGFDKEEKSRLKELCDQGIPMAVAMEEIDGALINVQSDFYRTGKLAAELIASQVDRHASVLLVAGDPKIHSNQLTTEGFLDYLHIHHKSIRCDCVFGYAPVQIEQIRKEVEDKLSKDDSIQALFSVNARGSVMLSEIAASLDKPVRLVGSDLFLKNVHSMKAGIMQNIIFKNPREQAYMAGKALFEYLLRGTPPKTNTLITGSHVIFQSNLDWYLTGNDMAADTDLKQPSL